MSKAMKLSPQVGFIGLGDQGGPMAVAVAEAGFVLHAWARRPTSLSVLKDVPHSEHKEPAELAAACDVLCLCLTDDSDVWNVLNQTGFLKALRAGSIVVNHGIGDPDENHRIAGLMKKDIEHFAEGVRSSGQDPTELRDRGIRGAQGLVEVVGLLARARPQRG